MLYFINFLAKMIYTLLSLYAEQIVLFIAHHVKNHKFRKNHVQKFVFCRSISFPMCRVFLNFCCPFFFLVCIDSFYVFFLRAECRTIWCVVFSFNFMCEFSSNKFQQSSRCRSRNLALK